MIEKNSELKAYVRDFESEDGTKILATTYMRPIYAIIDFHDLCKRIGFGIDPKSGYVFDGTNEPGHKRKWTAYSYGPIDKPCCRVLAIAGFNPNIGAVEVSWNGSIENILEIFDLIKEGELISPHRLERISKKHTVLKRILIWALWKFSSWSQRKAAKRTLKY